MVVCGHAHLRDLKEIGRVCTRVEKNSTLDPRKGESSPNVYSAFLLAVVLFCSVQGTRKDVIEWKGVFWESDPDSIEEVVAFFPSPFR
ncbi:hypothetical protein TNIN_332161 [Trichonephila inaurata madagascariensis]|uniref:Uncharacterized protein n=1 Tax=Trichonephila inaurata madagascariensis TaxID=2747483 RepID=A0A8X7BZI0_9ARAC|nr:hypothetical protein TNIN_332161 [Trichonephila inaurata madagascariensis]